MHKSGAYCGPANKGCGVIIEEKRSQALFEKTKWHDLVKHYIFIKGETLVKLGFQLKMRSVLRTNCK
jgi:hypothetical protein